MADYNVHPDPDVQQAIIRLCDRLCQFDRSTGVESVLIICDKSGFTFRALSGRPDLADDVTNEQLLQMIE